MKKLISGIIITTILFSCVPARKYEELKTKNDACQEELKQLKLNSEKFEVDNKELSQLLEKSQQDLIEAQGELERERKKFKDIESQYNTLNKSYKGISEEYERLLSNTASESRKLSSELESTRLRLQRKEDELIELEKNLNTLKTELEAKKVELEAKQTALQEREKKVNELEEIIAKKDATVNALKEKVANALLAYKDKGLTVEQKNGKIYVSLEAKLLFASGSTKVDNQGKDAIIKLAKALENESDLEIVVEGHTDNDALNSSTHPKDNWELSVLRATSVVKIMTENSTISPKILSASGRSEYLPVGDDKAKNRRIEVIVTPNLDQLFDIISNE